MSIGVIGGADGPTAVFVSSPVPWIIVIGIAVIMIGGIVAALLIAKKNAR